MGEIEPLDLRKGKRLIKAALCRQLNTWGEMMFSWGEEAKEGVVGRAAQRMKFSRNWPRCKSGVKRLGFGSECEMSHNQARLVGDEHSVGGPIHHRSALKRMPLGSAPGLRTANLPTCILLAAGQGFLFIPPPGFVTCI